MFKEYGVAFCIWDHLGRPQPDEDELYIRFAYSGFDVDNIQIGLKRINEYFES